MLSYCMVYFVNINIVFYFFISPGYTEDNFPSAREPERVNIMDFSEISKQTSIKKCKTKPSLV